MSTINLFIITIVKRLKYTSAPSNILYLVDIVKQDINYTKGNVTGTRKVIHTIEGDAPTEGFLFALFPFISSYLYNKNMDQNHLISTKTINISQSRLTKTSFLSG
jgi:hypothetical protein